MTEHFHKKDNPLRNAQYDLWRATADLINLINKAQERMADTQIKMAWDDWGGNSLNDPTVEMRTLLTHLNGLRTLFKKNNLSEVDANVIYSLSQRY